MVITVLLLLWSLCALSQGTDVDFSMPAAAPPVKPLAFCLDDAFAHNSHTGETMGADSLSLWVNDTRGKGVSRWYPIAGEIHPGRVPQSQWLEQLRRVQAGGLDTISVYVFWIFHEEKLGSFVFDGRRDVRTFLETAASLGLRVLLRIGPWNHGEVRNGGHPDWVLEEENCGSNLRSTDPKYLQCVESWYRALGNQVKGLFWKDGGPIFAVQLDNETVDWKYLLALKALARKYFSPVYYSKTGWPRRGKLPNNLSLMPYFGGYPDAVGDHTMNATTNSAEYQFRPLTVAGNYPYLGVEIGGGMAAPYNHRVHLSPDDMPSLHLVGVGSGFNGVGYYMYHGGNNPHSLVFPGNDPKTTLQESSFQPAGAKNPMPSASYDFFAPLGEFGQVRPHYHKMRRLHHLLRTWGSVLASKASYLPVTKRPNGVRAAVRSSSPDETGFVFVSNYERLSKQPDRSNVRLNLRWPEINRSIIIPPKYMEGIHVPSGVWFVWPYNLRAAEDAASPILLWATAQALTHIKYVPENLGTHIVWFFMKNDDIRPHLGFDVHGAKVILRNCDIMHRQGSVVLTNISTGTDIAASIVTDSYTVDIVLLDSADADSLWTPTIDGIQHVVLGREAQFVSGNDQGEMLVSTQSGKPLEMFVCPPPPGRPSSAGSAFAPISIGNKGPPMVKVSSSLVRNPILPTRHIPLSPDLQKPEEPTLKDWDGAAMYNLTLQLPDDFTPSNMSLTMGIDYVGDAGRILFEGKLLTDNWFSGYRPTEGGFEVGLSYLSHEHPGLLKNGANMTLLVLPMNRSALENNVFLQKVYWPKFAKNNPIAIELKGLETIVSKQLVYQVFQKEV